MRFGSVVQILLERDAFFFVVASLSHAEMLEDVTEDFVRGDYSLACYFCELREYDAQIFGDEVAAIVVIESLYDTCECLVCA